MINRRSRRQLKNNLLMLDADMSILGSTRISPTISRARIFDGQSDGIEKLAIKIMRPFQIDKASIDN